MTCVFADGRELKARSVTAEAERLRREPVLNDGKAAQLRAQLGVRVVRRMLHKNLGRTTEEISGAAASYFSQGNPRELKRFVNSFRLHYFLWAARRSRGSEVPTMDQLLSWTILTMRWPEVVRWGEGSELQPTSAEQAQGGMLPTLTTRLKLIEEISGSTTEPAAWQEHAKKVLRLTPTDAPWLNDGDLLLFFHNEYTQQPEGQRLSDGVGKGLC